VILNKGGDTKSLTNLFAQNLTHQEMLNIVQRKVDWILANSSPLYVYLFGSARSKTMTVASDVDLLLVFEDGLNLKDVSLSLSKNRPADDWPHDILFYSLSEFQQKKIRAGSICHEAETFGEIIFKREQKNVAK
jgi:predicted nucleotidyltransferase